MELVVEDQVVAAGATAAATVGTGPATPWTAAVVVFRGR
jgi:hypothetical protein